MKFSLGEFIDNIEKNGLKPYTGSTLVKENVDGKIKVTSGCALGQGIWNILGRPEDVDSDYEDIFWHEFSTQSQEKGIHIRENGYGISFTQRTVGFNDSRGYTPAQTAEALREEFKEHLDKEIEVSDYPQPLDT